MAFFVLLFALSGDGRGASGFLAKVALAAAISACAVFSRRYRPFRRAIAVGSMIGWAALHIFLVRHIRDASGQLLVTLVLGLLFHAVLLAGVELYAWRRGVLLPRRGASPEPSGGNDA